VRGSWGTMGAVKIAECRVGNTCSPFTREPFPSLLPPPLSLSFSRSPRVLDVIQVTRS